MAILPLSRKRPIWAYYASIYRIRARNACVRACVRTYVRWRSSSWAAIIMRWELSHAPRNRGYARRSNAIGRFLASGLYFSTRFSSFFVPTCLCWQSECVAVWTTAAAEWFSWRSGYYSRFDAIVMSASGTSAFPSSIFSSSIHEQTSAPFDRSLCRFALIRGIIFTSSFRSRFYEHTRWNRNNWLLLKELHSPRNEFEF